MHGASRAAPFSQPSTLRGCFTAALIALALTLAPAAGAAEVEHTVAKGQTLGRIAKRYRTTVDAIREVNGLKPGEQIHPGDTLIIPEKGKEAEAAKRRKGATDKAKRGEKDRKPEKDRRRDDGKSYAQKPKRPGFVRLVRGAEQLEIQLLTRDGRLVPKALPKLSRLLRSPAGTIPIDPRLATLIGMVSDHFGGRTLRVVSGYRPYSPTQYTPHSNHNVGRAMDFMVEGVPNSIVRDFCRGFRNAGVGYYPNSTFVHLDVRVEKVYWVDYSRPGEPPRYDAAGGRVAPDEAARDVTENTQDASQDSVYGSKDTQPPVADPVDKTDTNQRTPNPSPEIGRMQGINRPPSPARPAPPSDASRTRSRPEQAPPPSP